MLGAYKCENLHDYTEFKVGIGLTDNERKNPLKRGTVITYKYFEKNKITGKPRFPVFLRKKVKEW